MSDHPPIDLLERFRQGTLPVQELLRTDDHLRECSSCRRLAGGPVPAADALRKWREALDRLEDRLSLDEVTALTPDFARPEAEETTDRITHADIARRWRQALTDEAHLPFEVLAGYADHTLSPDDQRLVREHLAQCEQCREEAEDLVTFSEELGTERPVRRNAFRYWSVATAAAAMLVVAVWILRTRPEPEHSPVLIASTRSMAVFPFRNVSGNSGDDFLSTGLADAMVTRLEQDSSLSLRPMASTLRAQQESVDRRTVIEKLKVDAVLEGQFSAVADLVRVSLQLIETRSGRPMWSESVEGPRVDLLNLIDRLSARAQSRLSGLPAAERGKAGSSAPRSSSPQAYEAYLHARSFGGSLVQSRYASQVRALRRAIELDPDFAAAHADLAIALQLTGLVRGLDTGDTLDRVEWHARAAVRLDPRLPEAHLALGRALSTDPSRYPEAIREIVTTLELKPTSTHSLQILTSYLASLGELDRARCLSERIMRIDPLSDEAKLLGYWSIEAGDPSAALRSADRALADPDTALAGHDIRGAAFILQGDLAAVDREAESALRLYPDHYLGKSLKAMVAAGHGRRAESEAWLAKFDQTARRNHFAAVRVALCYAKLGHRDAALEWIERAVDLGHSRWYSLSRHPWLDSLRSEPRFQSSLARVKRYLDEAHPDVLRLYPSICPPSDGEESGAGTQLSAIPSPRIRPTRSVT